jgi:hypothetical protein
MSNLPNQIFTQLWLGLRNGSSQDFLPFWLLGQTCMKLSTCLWKQLKFLLSMEELTSWMWILIILFFHMGCLLIYEAWNHVCKLLRTKDLHKWYHKNISNKITIFIKFWCSPDMLVSSFDCDCTLCGLKLKYLLRTTTKL